LNHLNLINVKKEERYAVFLSFIYYFCLLAAYYIMRPIRDQLAVEVGSAHLPEFFAITFIVTLLLTPAFSLLASLYPRYIILPVVYLFFIVCQFIFMLFWHDADFLSVKNLGMLFFVFVSVFNLFVVSVFWSFMTDLWVDEQARRLFPIIALGGTLGALVGPLLTRSLVQVIGESLLMWVSILFLVVAIICIVLLGSWARQYGLNRHKKDNEAALGGGMLDGLKQIFTDSFITNMAIMMILTDAIGTIAYVLVIDYSGWAFPQDAIAQTRFAANMDLTSNIIQIILQLTVTRWLLVRFGAGLVIAISASIVVVSSLIMAFSNDPYALVVGIFPSVALVLIVTRALAHSMILSARETLYTLVSRNLRYKGKNAVDTVVWRAGDLLSLGSINIFRNLGVTISGFGIIWALLAATSGWIGWRLAKRVEAGEFEEKS